MKILEILFIIFCLLSLINSTCEPDEENNKIRDKDDCVKRIFSDEEVNMQAYKCCYMRQKISDNTRKGNEYSCIFLTQNDYNNITNLIKQYEKETGIEDVKIDCGSTYLIYTIISLFLLLL